LHPSARARRVFHGSWACYHVRAVQTFDAVLGDHGLGQLVRGSPSTLQLNVGKRCNMACHHCHVDAGPKRTEQMPPQVAERVLELLAQSSRLAVLDITGGAPELNENFKLLVREARRLGRHVIDRCNLSVLFEPHMEGLAEFLAQQRVHVIASLPCYLAENVDRQRGTHAFDKSIRALRLLNDLGYGSDGSGLELDLVYNPVGAFLPPEQCELEKKYKAELLDRFGLVFHRLLTITNMPIARFASMLERSGQYGAYMSLLVNHFNPGTVLELMCRSLVSVGWDGELYDCDFNQMLELPLGGQRLSVFELASLDALEGRRIATGRHCFGCAAGAGSSCGGALGATA